MINKKTLAVTALALLLSQQSFASEGSGFYFGGGYHGQFFNSTSSLEVKSSTGTITNLNINDRDAEKTKSQKLSDYKADYNPPFAASLAVGYEGEFKNNNYRVELEGMYSSIKVDNIGLANSQVALSYKKTENSDDNLYGVIVDHDHIENRSVMANIYHHWKNDRFSFSPYFGAGIGATRVKMFEKASIRPAYQIKAGLNYSMTEDTEVHFGYRHFGAIGTDLELTTTKLGKMVDDSQPNKKKFESATGPAVTEKINIGNKLFATHGLEVGLTVHFASRA